MVTARILATRRRPPAPRRLRSRPRRQPAPPRPAYRRHLGAFGRIYAAAALIGVGLVMYLLQAAHVTETSYEIQQLRATQSQLFSQQQELGYQQASLEAPMRLQEEAALQGMRRASPARYLATPQIALNLGTPQLAQAPRPGWEDVVAGLIGVQNGAAGH